MGFGMFSANHSPIAIDFGSSSVKLLQVTSSSKPAVSAAAELPIPDATRSDQERLFTFHAQRLPKLIRTAGFKGRRTVISVPSSQTFMQHMQITETDGIDKDDLIKAQLQSQAGISSQGVVVRSVNVGQVNRDGQTKNEMICLAISKDTVMRYVDLLRKCKLEVVGVHTELLAMVRAFEHLHRRSGEEEITTLYVDMGWGGTRVAIAHGNEIVFARSISIGGKHFDQLISTGMKCDPASARAHRISLQEALDRPAGQSGAEDSNGSSVADSVLAGSSAAGTSTLTRRFLGIKTKRSERRKGDAPAELGDELLPCDAPKMALNVDITELLDTITDELSMCLRYHRGVFSNRRITRTIFLGGESKQRWLCQHVVKQLAITGYIGDPLARFDTEHVATTPGVTLEETQPGWAVTSGLCIAPTDL